MAELDDFHQFSQLPLEIREMIWRFALPAIRIIYAGSFPFPDGEPRPAGARRPRRNARSPHCPRSSRDLLPKALREDMYHRSGDYAPVPALLHVCTESRSIAVESGYVLAFSGPDSPNRIWFNPETDYMQISSWEHTGLTTRASLQELAFVTKAAVEVFEFDQRGAALECMQNFENLEEVLLVIKHTYPHPEDCVIIDCKSADISDGSTFWHPPQFYYNNQATWNGERGDSYLSFHEHFLRHQERYIDDLRQEERIWRGKPGSAIPEVRFVYVTDLDGKMDLEKHSAASAMGRLEKIRGE